MIESLEIKGLRGIRHGVLNGLSPLTILVGPNGCGKSTVLEAAGVACAGNVAVSCFNALALREWLGFAGLDFWGDLDPGIEVIAHWGEQSAANGATTTTRVRRGAANTALVTAARGSGETGDLVQLDAQCTTETRNGDVPASSTVTRGSVLVNEDGFAGWFSQGKEAREPRVRFLHLGLQRPEERQRPDAPRRPTGEPNPQSRGLVPPCTVADG